MLIFKVNNSSDKKQDLNKKFSMKWQKHHINSIKVIIRSELAKVKIQSEIQICELNTLYFKYL